MNVDIIQLLSMNPWAVGDSPVILFTLVNTARESLNPFFWWMMRGASQGEQAKV